VIHGTNAPNTIGAVATLGCFRLVNDGIVDLYNRAAIDAKVVTRN
jgi:lipoprotein-anchoring transpeptidase ErfK/SrfK